LLPTKVASREAVASMRPGDRSGQARVAISPYPPARTSARKARYIGPTADAAKVWTDESTLPRVRKVPKVVSANAPTASARFQTRSMPRRSSSMIECSSAVATSQGSSAAFSTGSHAQYPPQPSTEYDQRAPRSSPTVRKHHTASVQRLVSATQRSERPSPSSPPIANAKGTVKPMKPRYRNGG
jgi:hypothetical protein